MQAVRARPRRRTSPSPTVRRGTNGVSTSGVTANLLFFDRGTFCVLPLTNFYILCFPTFGDPICPQPNCLLRGASGKAQGGSTPAQRPEPRRHVRPISLLRLSLLDFLTQDFWEIPYGHENSTP